MTAGAASSASISPPARGDGALDGATRRSRSNRLTDERVAEVAAQYPKVGHLTADDIDDTMFAELIADLVGSELALHGHRRRPGRKDVQRVPAEVPHGELWAALATVETEILNSRRRTAPRWTESGKPIPYPGGIR